MILAESHLKILNGLQDKKSLNIVKIPAKKTLRELIDEVSKKFSNEELLDMPQEFIIIYKSENGIGTQGKYTEDVSAIVGLLECVKSMELEKWHERDRDITVYDY